MNKKFNKKKLIPLAIAILLFFVAFAIEENFFRTRDYIIDVEKFQSELFKKEDEVYQVLDRMSKDLDKSNLNQLLKTNFSNNYSDNYKSKGYTIMVYANDSLKYWTDNSNSISNLYSKSNLRQKIVQLNNGWYLICHKHKNQYDLIVLILIKYNYLIENEFLQNEFHPDFAMSPYTRISLYSLSYGEDIYDRENNYLFSLEPKNKPDLLNPYYPVLEIVYLLGSLFTLLFFQRIFKGKMWGLLSLSMLFISLRVLMVVYKFPVSLYSLPLFKPESFGMSDFLPSLGDFLLDALILFFICYNFVIPSGFYKIKKLSLPKQKSAGLFFSLFSLLVIIISFWFIGILLEGLILNSSISFEVYKLSSLKTYSILGFLIIALLFASFSIITDKLLKFISEICSFSIFLIGFIITAIGLAALWYYFKISVDIFDISVVIILLGIIVFIRFKNKNYRYYTFVLLNLFLALFTVAFITIKTEEKEKGKGQVLVTRLVTERDPIAEHLLNDIKSKMSVDKYLKNMILSKAVGSKIQVSDVMGYLQNKYFQGYWGKYDLECVLCGTPTYFDPTNELKNCEGYYNDLIKRYGSLLPFVNYFFLDYRKGNIGYFGTQEYYLENDSAKVVLFIKLDSKITIEELGYPELLLDKKLNRTSLSGQYSYAKYRFGQLLIKSGIYPYSLNSEMFTFNSQDEYTFISQNDYDHLIYKLNNDNIIILSKPGIKFIDLLISFSYIFLFFNILVGLFLILMQLPVIMKGVYFDFKNKLMLSMVAVLFLSFLLVGGGTIYYNSVQYRNKHERNISEKSQSVLVELEQIFANDSVISPDWHRIDYRNISELLIKLSRVFFIDINFYDLNGTLMASSRPEIFGRGLTGEKINPKAFRELVYKNSTLYIQDETIGKLSYASAYVPFRNRNNQILAYLNLPYFTKPSLLKKEISNVVVTVINLYVLLFLISILVAVFISNKVTQPLRFIQSKFREIELGKKNEPIIYTGHDEIASLVREYNRMLIELAESVELLARSERESAWREMAKQIAHEIKNPLTPMRLSVQFLQKSWNNNDANFGQRIENVTATIIEQIDNLSSIAAEFSNFAKMPKANNEVVEIVSKLRNTASLFENTKNVKINLDLHNHQEVKVFADKEQLTRVFINLVKNGIQAIPENQDGIINLELMPDGESVTVMVQDNGTGIPEDKRDVIFTPNFTTKSSGMGLGLAIVKNIIENAKGKIWFETEVGQGTKFFVELPIFKELAHDDHS